MNIVNWTIGSFLPKVTRLRVTAHLSTVFLGLTPLSKLLVTSSRNLDILQRHTFKLATTIMPTTPSPTFSSVADEIKELNETTVINDEGVEIKPTMERMMAMLPYLRASDSSVTDAKVWNVINEMIKIRSTRGLDSMDDMLSRWIDYEIEHLKSRYDQGMAGDENNGWDVRNWHEHGERAVH